DATAAVDVPGQVIMQPKNGCDRPAPKAYHRADLSERMIRGCSRTPTVRAGNGQAHRLRGRECALPQLQTPVDRCHRLGAARNAPGLAELCIGYQQPATTAKPEEPATRPLRVEALQPSSSGVTEVLWATTTFVPFSRSRSMCVGSVAESTI